jgi:hypothetical protein
LNPARAVWGFNMQMHDEIRNEQLSYKYVVPTYEELHSWVKREPTRSDFKLSDLTIGCIVPLDCGSDDFVFWVVMDLIKVPKGLDVHWLLITKTEIGHYQQVFYPIHDIPWNGAFFQLVPKDGELCPHCCLELEWATLALRCPNCWWVK